MHFRLDFLMEANNMDPDETATKGAVWCGSILFAIKATLEDNQIRGENNKSHDWQGKG